MLGKKQAKIILKYYEQNFCQTFQAPYSLHKPPCCFILPSSLSQSVTVSEFCDQIFEDIFFFLDFLVQKIFFDKNH